MYWRTSSGVSAIVLVLAGLNFTVADEPAGRQITNSIGMKLTLVPSGEYVMGSGESAEQTAAFFKKNYGMDRLTADPFKNEHPQHRVRITKSFYLRDMHVTRGQFRRFVEDSGYKTDLEKIQYLGPLAGTPMRGRSCAATTITPGATRLSCRRTIARLSSRATSTQW